MLREDAGPLGEEREVWQPGFWENHDLLSAGETGAVLTWLGFSQRIPKNLNRSGNEAPQRCSRRAGRKMRPPAEREMDSEILTGLEQVKIEREADKKGHWAAEAEAPW